MTIVELEKAAKIRIRKSMSDDLDSDVKNHIDAAIADLKRIGVDDSWLSAPTDAIIIEAILYYVRANYSIDVIQYPVLSGIYDKQLTKIKGDSKYFSAMAAESSEPSGSST